MFQIIFTPASSSELARMPKELQLQILGEFRGLPQQVLGTELDEFGKLEQGGLIILIDSEQRPPDMIRPVVGAARL